MTLTYREFGAIAVKSRRSRPGTGVAVGSGMVVRTLLRRCSPTTGTPVLRILTIQ